VFGQTIVKGKNEGVNAFLVPIRDKDMKPYSGIEIRDMGFKIGQNGVDNAALIFNNVRIPRENMMNKLSDVDEKGVFHSSEKSLSRRFFAATERLLSGRLCIASMSLSSMKGALYIAITYSKQRLAVGPTEESDTPIFNY
jgi:acyl-CoA oxidase